MPTKLIYQMLVKLLSWIVLRPRSDTTKGIDSGDRRSDTMRRVFATMLGL